MHVKVDFEACESHGECVFAAPEVFELDDDDLLRWVAEPDASLREKVQRAVALCPTQAIKLED
jgi:ferredoxin